MPTHKHRLSKFKRHTFWFCRFYSSQADVKRVRQREENTKQFARTRRQGIPDPGLSVINVTFYRQTLSAPAGNKSTLSCRMLPITKDSEQHF